MDNSLLSTIIFESVLIGDVLCHRYQIQKRNQEQPFVKALKNKFNLDAISPEYIASVRAGAEGALPARNR